MFMLFVTDVSFTQMLVMTNNLYQQAIMVNIIRNELVVHFSSQNGCTAYDHR